jgi:ABC-type multidrug transport system fused ATPase/permease subunit
MAYIHDFIMTLPEGYETVVGDRGDRLSGGQRQRIALARALLQNPDILILDEATSALDAESEDKISQAVDELSGSVTILIVAHRFSTIKKADFIYMIQSGEVVEEGAWDELMAKKGAFWALSEFQR